MYGTPVPYCTESLWRQRKISGSSRVATLDLQTLNANNSVYHFLYSVPFFICSFGDPQYLQSMVSKLKADRQEFDSYLTLYGAYHSAEEQVTLLSSFQKIILKLTKTVESKAHDMIKRQRL